ncbi:hypothetical protein QQ008_16775 [Fulvivirgaceae bacterium BMA10]|uniref:Uncharacterized protein n=1 Tax=Splendidivirga corallicola TaxID=3051826 RepID=A0ABT8KQP6_9BACT|nr:hypothetical protein [Fulvivirgaceae bacterium BMA10]
MKRLTGVFLLLIGFVISSKGQQTIGTYLGDESALYAATKQVNQFFRRFNSEEDLKGNRIYKGSKHFRNPKTRRKYLKVLFDNETSQINADAKNGFIAQVTNGASPFFLDFHGGEWFAEVRTKFLYHGKEETAILFMELQEEKVGSKWVIKNVYFEPFVKLFEKEKENKEKFLHPLSHELAFMNLQRIFSDKSEVEEYTANDFRPDHLSLFLFEIKRSSLEFKSVTDLTFHFFQADNWYFELKEFNRSGYNTGWLIANLVKANEQEKDLLRKYIYFENR